MRGTYPNLVADRIRAAREKAGLTQKQLGEAAGIAEPTIRRYELGRLNPKIETLENLARALGCSALELKYGAPEERTEERRCSEMPERKSAAPRKGERLEITLKGLALVELAEAGVIQREESGGVDTEGFERFWEAFEPKLMKAVNDAIWDAL